MNKPNPNLTQKSPTSIEAFSYDWGQEAIALGASSLVSAVWEVDPDSTITLDSVSELAGSIPLYISELYGASGSLAGATLILNVAGAGLQTLTMPTGSSAYADSTHLLAGINAQWPGIASQGVNNGLFLQASTLVAGLGTANAALGLPNLLSSIRVNGGTSGEVAVLWCKAGFSTGDFVTKSFWIYIINETPPNP